MGGTGSRSKPLVAANCRWLLIAGNSHRPLHATGLQDRGSNRLSSLMLEQRHRPLPSMSLGVARAKLRPCRTDERRSKRLERMKSQIEWSSCPLSRPGPGLEPASFRFLKARRLGGCPVEGREKSRGRSQIETCPPKPWRMWVLTAPALGPLDQRSLTPRDRSHATATQWLGQVSATTIR